MCLFIDTQSWSTKAEIDWKVIWRLLDQNRINLELKEGCHSYYLRIDELDDVMKRIHVMLPVCCVYSVSCDCCFCRQRRTLQYQYHSLLLSLRELWIMIWLTHAINNQSLRMHLCMSWETTGGDHWGHRSCCASSTHINTHQHKSNTTHNLLTTYYLPLFVI